MRNRIFSTEVVLVRDKKSNRGKWLSLPRTARRLMYSIARVCACAYSGNKYDNTSSLIIVRL